MNRYPAYKPSGIEWLGEIPAHWDLSQLKRKYNVQLGKMLRNEPATSQDTLEPYLRAANVQWEGVDVEDVKEMWFSPYEKKQHSLTKGDLIVSEGGDVGRSAIWNGQLEPCYIQNAVHRVRNRGNNSNRFLYFWIYYLKHFGYIDLICSKATIAHLTVEKLNALPLVAPPIEEQQAIVVFLDEQTAVLDNLISEKQALIGLLQEKRAAVISRAVTQGLNSAVALKDSGVDWIGRIPIHWEIMRLKFLATFYGGGTPSKDSIAYWNGDIPWVSPKDMKSEIVFDTIDHVTEEAIVESSTKLINEDALLIVVRSGILRHTIPVAVAARPMAINQDMKALILKTLINPHYLASLIRGHQGQLLTIWRKQGATVESIEHEFMANTLIPVPPIQEQRNLVRHIENETSQLDTLISETEASIATLQEYRTALIATAVTGQIDVRQFQ